MLTAPTAVCAPVCTHVYVGNSGAFRLMLPDTPDHGRYPVNLPQTLSDYDMIKVHAMYNRCFFLTPALIRSADTPGRAGVPGPQ
jgi:hypothetical protein